MVITMEASIKKRENGGWRDNYFLKAFFLGMGLSFLVFLPFLLVDGGRFLFYGDFNVQQAVSYTHLLGLCLFLPLNFTVIKTFW